MLDFIFCWACPLCSNQLSQPLRESLDKPCWSLAPCTQSPPPGKIYQNAAEGNQTVFLGQWWEPSYTWLSVLKPDSLSTLTLSLDKPIPFDSWTQNLLHLHSFLSVRSSHDLCKSNQSPNRDTHTHTHTHTHTQFLMFQPTQFLTLTSLISCKCYNIALTKSVSYSKFYKTVYISMKKIKRCNLIVEFIMVLKLITWYYTVQCLDKAWQIFTNIKYIYVEQIFSFPAEKKQKEKYLSRNQRSFS